VSSAPLAVIKDGVLATWFLDSATARELGLTTNGRAARGGGGTHPSSTNLTLLPGDKSPDELIAGIDHGVYVTELIGHGANLITGDYSRGAAGFLIEKGELTTPVSEITIAGNLKDMFARLVVANDLEYKFATNAPTIVIAGMTIAGR
jgi:PmbA protein